VSKTDCIKFDGFKIDTCAVYERRANMSSVVYETLMSEREDLLDQLEKQDFVMTSIKQKLEEIKWENRQLQESISNIKLEIKGRNRCQSSEEVVKQELGNRMLATEIHCLKSQLCEMDKDYLGKLNSLWTAFRKN